MIFIISSIILSLDQLSKFLIIKYFSPYESLPLIKGIFHLSLVHNRGAAFGILKNQVFVFIVTALIAIILIFLHLFKQRKKKFSLYSLSLGLIFAGASGNLIDRICFGYVIDFFDFRIWPVFNIADSSITIGAILLGWSVLITKKR